MSFELDTIEYESSCERLQVTKVENISEHMNKILIVMILVLSDSVF